MFEETKPEPKPKPKPKPKPEHPLETKMKKSNNLQVIPRILFIAVIFIFLIVYLYVPFDCFCIHLFPLQRFLFVFALLLL